LPKTGIEYPYTKERKPFINSHKEFELLSEQSVPQYMLDEYIRNDLEKGNA